MKIVVSDANILINLSKMRLIESFLRADYSVHVPDLVWFEIGSSESSEFTELLHSPQVLICEFDGVELETIVRMKSRFKTLSLADCSCLRLTQREGARLSTGDKALTREARDKLGLVVHGLLWPIQEMMSGGNLSPDEAAGSLARLQGLNPRSPRRQIKEMLEQLRKNRLTRR